MKLNELPDDVLYCIAEYFEIGDELNEILNHYKFFKNVKEIRKKYLFRLSKKQSLRYYDMLYKQIPQTDWFRKITKYKLALNLFDCSRITDVSRLGKVHILNLSYCHRIIDVSALGNVHTLVLVWCNRLTDVSALGNVHKLNLSNCPNIRDVSALGNVHTLYLIGCRNITDVSALKNVHTLNLRGV